MVTMIETDLKEVLGEIKTQLSQIQGDVTDLKITQAEIKGELETFKAEVKGELETIKAESKGEFSTVKNELAFIRAHIPQLRAEKKIVHLYYFFLRRFIIDFNNFIKNPV